MLKVFISATSADLIEARRHVTELVLQNGGLPIVEEGFEAEADNVSARRTINLKLRAADAVIHLAGLYYGGEPIHQKKRGKRRSWTQMEYHEAKALNKDVLVCLADSTYYESGLPEESGNKAERETKARLQREHYKTLERAEGWHHRFRTIADLTKPVANFLGRLRGGKREKSGGTRMLYVGAQKGTGGAGYADFDLRGQLRSLKKNVAAGKDGRKICIVSVFDATPLEILAKVNEVRPEILHISGAQEAGCIKLHDKNGRLSRFDAERLADLIADSNDGSLRLVVLDTCYSMQQAKRLTKRGVPYAIGIYDAIADDVSTEYYSGFYNALASGKDLQSALTTASNLILGSAQADHEWLCNLETEVLEMAFDQDLHLPRVSVGSGLKPEMEKFV